MTLSDHQYEFLKDFCLLIRFATERGFKVTGGELYRTPEMQEIYIKTGKSWTTSSMHLKKCAIDLNFFKNFTILTYKKEDLEEIGRYWESLNPLNKWGGLWKEPKTDTDHFERNIK